MRIINLLLISLLVFSCKPKKIEQESIAGSVDASSFVAIGGDRVAGYQDDALSYNGQMNSLGALLHTQLRLIEFSEYNQPLLANQSLGINTNGDAQLIMGYKTDCNSEVSLSPVRFATAGNTTSLSDDLYNTQGPFNNMGIPSVSVGDLSVSGFSNPYYDRFSSGGGNSIINDVLANNPTFFLSDLGQDDLLNYALSGGTGAPSLPATGAGSFEEGYGQLLTSLSLQGAKGVLCDIPDITSFPYFTTIPYNGLELDSTTAATMNAVFNPLGFSFIVGTNPFTVEDAAEPFGVRKLLPGELIMLSVPLDSIKCEGMGTIVPIPDKYVLSLSEIDEIKTKTDAYNLVIQNLADLHQFAVADFNSLFNSLNLGLMHNGANYSNTFVSGGFFSLDGRNPTPKGMVLLVNRCINAINKKYGSSIPHADINAYDGVLFP